MNITGRNGIRRFRVHPATMDLNRVLKFYRTLYHLSPIIPLNRSHSSR